MTVPRVRLPPIFCEANRNPFKGGLGLRTQESVNGGGEVVNIGSAGGRPTNNPFCFTYFPPRFTYTGISGDSMEASAVTTCMLWIIPILLYQRSCVRKSPLFSK